MEKIFKAKLLANGRWVEFNLEDIRGNNFVYVSGLGMVNVDLKNCCQYTGINDSEGNRIFDRDEVRVAGVGNVIVTMTVNGIMFGDEDYQSCIEDIERLTGHNIHNRG